MNSGFICSPRIYLGERPHPAYWFMRTLGTQNLGGAVHNVCRGKIAESNPKGPVYLMAAREVLEGNVSGINVIYEVWDVISPNALSDRDVEHILDAYADLEQEAAAAGGAFACSVRKPEEVRNALLAGLRRERRPFCRY